MGYDEQIKELREKISGIDNEMVTLFERRMKVIDEVAILKKQYGKDVLDAKREDEIIEQVISMLEDKNLSDATAGVLPGDDGHKQEGPAAGDAVRKNRVLSNFRMLKNAKAAYLGIKGSYSYIVAQQSFDESSKLINYPSFEAILEALKNDEVDYAMLPAENTQTGSVTPAIDALARYGYYIVGEKLLPVSHTTCWELRALP